MGPHPTQEPTVEELFDLRGKVALLSGASGHLGSAFSRALAEAGASVIASSRSLKRARHAIEELPCHNHATHYAVEIDQISEQSIRDGFEDAVHQAGKIDILVNNGHDPLGEDWTTVTADQFTRQLSNATGYFLLARLLREHVVARRAPGNIIIIGSMYGVVGSYPDAYEDVCAASPVAYHALKGGLVHITRHLAVYWARDGIRVNCLSPGPFPNQQAPEQMVQRLCEKSPMGRMGQPFELKGALLFLASDASSYMTGQNILIDGGWTAW